MKPQKPKKGELIDKDSKEPKGVTAAKELAKATKSAPFQVRHYCTLPRGSRYNLSMQFFYNDYFFSDFVLVLMTLVPAIAL